MSQMYYLNNSGTRWLYRPNTEYFLIVHNATSPNAIIIRRRAKFFEQFGNFAAIFYSYKGKVHSSVTYSTDPKDLEGHAKLVEGTALPYMVW